MEKSDFTVVNRVEWFEGSFAEHIAQQSLETMVNISARFWQLTALSWLLKIRQCPMVDIPPGVTTPVKGVIKGVIVKPHIVFIVVEVIATAESAADID